MKFFILIASLLLVTTAKAQNISADEMVSKSNCKSFECFNEFITKKGFSYEASPKIANATSYVFLSDISLKTSNPEVKTKNISTIVITIDTKISCVGFRTQDKIYYHKMLTAFQNKGFKSVKTSPTVNGITTMYESQSHPNATLTVTVDKQDRDGLTWTSYDFEYEAHR